MKKFFNMFISVELSTREVLEKLHEKVKEKYEKNDTLKTFKRYDEVWLQLPLNSLHMVPAVVVEPNPDSLVNDPTRILVTHLNNDGFISESLVLKSELTLIKSKEKFNI